MFIATVARVHLVRLHYLDPIGVTALTITVAINLIA